MTNPVQTLRFFDELANLFSDIAAQARASDANELAQQLDQISTFYLTLRSFGNNVEEAYRSDNVNAAERALFDTIGVLISTEN